MKILVGISGGVDSAFAAKKLLLDGHEVEGAVLIMHQYTELESAREVADSIGIKLHEIDCRSDFECVKEDFVHQYVNGRTPNPCIICNPKVKFKALYDFALANGFDAIATGHYARVATLGVGDSLRYTMEIAEDSRKDQTYMLYRLPQNILSKLILPLSEGKKSDIRLLAAEQGISAANKSDSQEICFLPEGNYTEYIESVSGKCREGNFVDSEGRVLGKHKGIIHYTVGQRKGLGIALGSRAFVTDINPVTRDITLSLEVGKSKIVRISDMVYSGLEAPSSDVRIPMKVKLRYTAPLVDTEAELHPDGTATLHFTDPVSSAPGQSAVLYNNNMVMCGGFIEK